MRIVSILLICLLNLNGLAQEKYRGQTIQEILELPEEEINIGLSTLVLAKEFYPELNINIFLHKFEYMADRFNVYFGKCQNSEDQIRALNTYLYQKGVWNNEITFSYDDGDLQVTQRKNRFINGYIDTQKGSCITMPMLYLILGEKLGFPIHPVRSPKHFFVRYIPDEATLNFQDNIEATNGGSYISDKQYQDDVLIPDKAIENGVYLRTLSKKEYLATLLSVNATEYMLMDSLDKAKEYLQLAMKYDSTFSGAYWNYGILYLQEARKLEALMNSDKRTEVVVFQAMSRTKANAPMPFPSTNFSWDQHLANLGVPLPTPKPNNPFDEFQRKYNRLNSIPNRNNVTRHPRPKNQIVVHPQPQQALYDALRRIEERYVPLIQKKLAVYRKFRTKAEELGYVKEFPLEFFQKQSKSLKQFQESGGY